MFHGAYEDIVRFASEGRLNEELRGAKAEFVERTGELFESDASFERRLASFLEWYVLDRVVSFAPGMTPAKLYIESVADKLSPEDVNRLRGLTKSILSLFEFKRAKDEHMHVVDLLSNRKYQVFERRKPAGLEPSDVLEARLVPYDEKLVFSEAFGFAPREARRAILKAVKAFRKRPDATDDDRVALVHKVAYLSNRCERYKHVDPKTIFEDLKE
jgi:hypothetical protein